LLAGRREHRESGDAGPQGEIMPDISPEPLLNAVLGFYRTSAIKAAVELDLFTAIGDGAKDVAAIARRTGAAERGIQTLADYLAVMGFLDKAEGRYGLAPSTAAFLDRRSPAFMGDTTASWPRHRSYSWCWAIPPASCAMAALSGSPILRRTIRSGSTSPATLRL
jgi:hypothetical protein